MNLRLVVMLLAACAVSGCVCAKPGAETHARKARTGAYRVYKRDPLFKSYDFGVLAAVQARWYALLEEALYEGEDLGEVELRFRLHPDGSISDLTAKSTVVPGLAALAEAAVEDSAPFEAWPEKARRKVKDYREVAFTFEYN